MNRHTILFPGLLLWITWACGTAKTNSPQSREPVRDTVTETPFTGPTHDTLMSIPHAPQPVSVQILAPSAKARGTVLLLHGWNLPYMEWCEKTDFCSKATAQGYYVIVPDFKKSAYQYTFYPETIERYRSNPTRQWMLDSLFPFIRTHTGLLQPGQPSFVLGLSTGGRGALLLALDAPGIFRASASLSGDFDQREMPADNIMTNYYGAIKKFPERWSGKDNIAARASELKVPVYLAHTRDDKVVPFAQTQLMYDSLKHHNPSLDVVFVPVDTSGHTYTFWGACTDEVLQFFGKYD